MPSRKIIRSLICIFLPVPLFILLFFGVGFVIPFLIFGYIIMGIPSLIYAFLLEGIGCPKITDRKRYIGTGTLIGFLSSFIYIFATEGLYNDGDMIRAILTSTFVGFVIPLALITIKDKPCQQES